MFVIAMVGGRTLERALEVTLGLAAGLLVLGGIVLLFFLLRDHLRDWSRKPVFWLGVVVVLAMFVFAYMVGGRTLEGAYEVLLGLAAGFPFFGGVVLLYFLPSLIARKKPNGRSVFLVNLLLGWTLIGWVVALKMANNPRTPGRGNQVNP